jgi:hypothetical protein
MFAYNTSYHVKIQETPFFLQHGRDPKLISDIIINKNEHAYDDVHSYGQELVDKLRSVYKRVHDIYTDINNKRQEVLDTVKEKEYNIGDKVLLYDPTTKIGLSRKLTIRWKGPYNIIQKHSDINYVIDIDGRMSLVNKHRLRPYVQNDGEAIHESELALLKDEVDRISELEIEVRGQKQYKQQQLEIAIAQNNINQEENEIANNNHQNERNVDLEEINENNSDIQVNTSMVMFNW